MVDRVLNAPLETHLFVYQIYFQRLIIPRLLLSNATDALIEGKFFKRHIYKKKLRERSNESRLTSAVFFFVPKINGGKAEIILLFVI